MLMSVLAERFIVSSQTRYLIIYASQSQ